MAKFENLTGEFNKSYDRWLMEYPMAIANSKSYIIGVLLVFAFQWARRIDLDIAMNIIETHLRDIEPIFRKEDK